jgi:hypothetical protein
MTEPAKPLPCPLDASIAEILDQWDKVQADRTYARQCLENTGPGESPYTNTQSEAWSMREHCLGRTLLAAMPELVPLLLNRAADPRLAELRAIAEGLEDYAWHGANCPYDATGKCDCGLPSFTAAFTEWKERNPE